MSSALLSVLLVWTRILRHCGQFSYVMFILIGPHVRHFSDRNQTVSNVKKINHYAKTT
jgi:hypothetical protein